MQQDDDSLDANMDNINRDINAWIAKHNRLLSAVDPADTPAIEQRKVDFLAGITQKFS